MKIDLFFAKISCYQKQPYYLSLFVFCKRLTQRFLCLLQRCLELLVLCFKNFCLSLDLCIITALSSCVMNAELFARVYFLFMGACVSSVDKTVLINSTNSESLLSILHNSLIHSSLNRLILKVL